MTVNGGEEECEDSAIILFVSSMLNQGRLLKFIVGKRCCFSIAIKVIADANFMRSFSMFCVYYDYYYYYYYYYSILRQAIINNECLSGFLNTISTFGQTMERF